MLAALSSLSGSAIELQMRRLDASAVRLARGGAEPAGEVVEPWTAQRALEANVAVLKVANELTGTVLDLLA